MAAEDYIYEYDCDDADIMYDMPDGWPYKRRRVSKYPYNLPCKNCTFSKQYRCTRRRGIDKCPHAAWFKENYKQPKHET